MNPNETPTPNNDLPGIDDYQVTIPLVRTPARPDSPHEGRLLFRLPARNGWAAVMLGEHVAQHVAGAIQKEDGEPEWAVVVDQVHAERVDTPSVEELTSQVDHWKRIVTALARKLPGMLQVTAGEYEAADPNDLAVMPAGDATMMFLTPAFYAEVAAGLAEQRQPVVVGDLPEHEEPLLLPAAADLVLPDQPGGIDPDVRCARVGRLAEFFGGTVEIFVKGWWLPVEGVENGDDVISVTVDLRNTTAVKKPGTDLQALAFTDPQQLVPVRPATTLTIGSALGNTSGIAGRQLLHDGSWWTIRRADWNTTSRIHTADLISAERGETTAAVDEDTKILLRRRRPTEWSR